MRDESDNPTTQMSGQDDTFQGPAAAVHFKEVKIVWFDHRCHAQLLQSCNRECSDIFYHMVVWVDYTEGHAEIKQSCKNCFPSHRQRPSQS